MVAIVLVLVATTARASVRPNMKFPVKGVIINLSGKNLTVRKAPPDVNAFSYKLADKICSVGVGTVFEAIKEIRIVNGEVWYRVHIDREDVKNSFGWDGKDIDGWMAGRFRNRWAVSFLPEDIKRYERKLYKMVPPPLTTDPSTGQTTGETVQDPAGDPTEETSGAGSTGPLSEIEDSDDSDQGGFSILFRYFLLLLGSCTAVVVLAIEKSQSLNIKKWFSPIIPFEFVILGLANIIFVALLLNTFVKKSESSIVFECITVFAGPNFGFAFLGFIISVLLLKFMAFTRK